MFPKVISKAQNVFVNGRQILDAMLVENEVVDSFIRSNKNVVLCKLDLEKAYDHVDCHFLCSIMARIGFGDKWLNWIKWCISTASFSVWLMESLMVFFCSSRGLRQGDPLSPYLFVFTLEAFSRLVERAIDGSHLTSHSMEGRDGEGIKVSLALCR